MSCSCGRPDASDRAFSGVSNGALRSGIGRQSAVDAGPEAQPGARLIRDWNGSTHTVDVVEDGFVWNGERYRSLSAIARAITGARWSGPRFFGLDREGTR